MEIIIKHEGYEVKGKFCLSCGKKLQAIIRLSSQGRLTKTFSKICQSPGCRNFIDIKKISTWVTHDPGNYKRDFKTENQEKYCPTMSKRKKTMAISPATY